jgi:hypothetical protein
MPIAPLRHDEAESLRALLRLEVLDSPPETEFDALAQAAAHVCKMPTALVSLVDVDRQWFKARFGFDGPPETPRTLSFCAHAVVGEGLFVVEDATSDPRFADHPYVVGAPHIRFYAGSPLRLACGARIGTLCVIDSVPRQLSKAQCAALDRLALAVVRALEDRSACLRRDASDEATMPAVSFHHLEMALQNVDAAMRELLRDPRAPAQLAAPAHVGARSRPAVDAVPAPLRARLSAMRLCLTSTAALLGITYRLSAPEAVQSNEDRVKAGKQLADQTKVAGRAAYRAGLMLTDPYADDETAQVV